MQQKRINIAIDGFSSCGKSTLAKQLSKEIGYLYIDSGAMYRAATLFCIQNNLFNDAGGLNKEKFMSLLDSLRIEFRHNDEIGFYEIFLNGKPVENEIRSMSVSDKVSIVSSFKPLRDQLVKLQRKIGENKGVIMDGRDIGTVVFPDAELKIFLTASPEIRARRRFLELRSKGDVHTSEEEVLKNIERRDFLDQTREESPLKKAEDAIVYDNSHSSQEEQLQWALQQYHQALKNE